MGSWVKFEIVVRETTRLILEAPTARNAIAWASGPGRTRMERRSAEGAKSYLSDYALTDSSRFDPYLFRAFSAYSISTTIGVGRALAPPPSEPDVRISRIRLSSWWFTSERVDHTARGPQTKRATPAQQRKRWANGHCRYREHGLSASDADAG